MGVPGCPELAACTASIESVRIVLMLVSSMPLTGTAGEAVAGAISTPFALTLAVSLLRTNQVSGGRFERYPAHPRARLKSGRFVRPPPSCDFWAVNAVLECIALARDLLVAEPLLGVASNLLQRRGPVNHVHRQTKSVGLVFDRQLHRSIDVPLLLVASHVQSLVLAAVSQAVNQPGISVEVEDDWLVNREQRIEVPVRQPVRMFRVRFQLEQIHYVDETDLQVGKLLSQQHRCGQRLLCRYIASRGHNDIRLATLIVARPFPDADALRAMHNSGVDIQVLEVELLVGDDYIDVVLAPQAMIGYRQETIAVGRKIEPGDSGALVQDHVQEAGILVGETVVVLAP